MTETLVIVIAASVFVSLVVSLVAILVIRPTDVAGEAIPPLRRSSIIRPERYHPVMSNEVQVKERVEDPTPAMPVATASLTRNFSRAVKVDAESLRRLDKILSGISSEARSSYTTELIDGTELRFQTIDALVAYENPKRRALKSLRISASAEGAHVTVEISTETLFARSAVRLRGEGPDDQISKVTRDFEVWLGDVERGLLYSMFARQSGFSFGAWIMGVVFVAGLLVLAAQSGFALSQPVPKTEPGAVFILILFGGCAVVFGLAYVLNKLRAAYWPVATFAIGHGAKRDEDKHTWRMFWIGSVVASIVIGVVINLLV